ncbi:alpha/beta fold hydrolase [Gottfriedia sp. NPDC056225]|uniref:alpha/beta fold hydrolase n=1 Tax=Gottfriedia sp. NPDC056225 TaxID=3345751 RepID=UPI0035E29503
MQNVMLNIENKKVSYYEYGNKENQTIVCFHGLAGNAIYSFAELAKILENKFHLIVFDNPGHGKTTAFDNEDDYLFSNLSNWYNKVLKQVINKPFYLMGHSWGADIVLNFTKMNPNNVLGIVLLDGGFTYPENQSDMTFEKAYTGWSEYMDNSSYNNWDELIQEYKNYTKRWSRDIEHYVASLFTKNNQDQFELITSKFTVLSIVKAFFKEPFSKTYPFIKVPVMLIHATIPASLNLARDVGISQLNRSVKDVSVIAIEDTTHMIQWDEPNKVSNLITNWIKKHM